MRACVLVAGAAAVTAGVSSIGTAPAGATPAAGCSAATAAAGVQSLLAKLARGQATAAARLVVAAPRFGGFALAAPALPRGAPANRRITGRAALGPFLAARARRHDSVRVFSGRLVRRDGAVLRVALGYRRTADDIPSVAVVGNAVAAWDCSVGRLVTLDVGVGVNTAICPGTDPDPDQPVDSVVCGRRPA
jgi:hypothetical protein